MKKCLMAVVGTAFLLSTGTVGAAPKKYWYRDADRDGYGNPTVFKMSVKQPAGYVADNRDCNDGNSAVNPGVPEVCNGADDNCSGAIDEGVTSRFFQDADQDAFGNDAAPLDACSAPVGHVAASGDCDDLDAGVNPSATELCGDMIDQNCDGLAPRCRGTGIFVPGPALPETFIPDLYPTEAVAADFNGDGRVDFVESGNGKVALLINEGGGSFADRSADVPAELWNPLYPDYLRIDTRGLAVADVDNDGDKDIYCANLMSDYLFLNQGNGVFDNASATLPVQPPGDYAGGAAFGDLDNDGDQDLVVMALPNALIYRNDGGIFTDVSAAANIGGVSGSPGGPMPVVLLDIDADGDLDIFFGRYQQQNLLYVNDGSGVFSDATGQLPAVVFDTLSAAAGDVDADGYPDIMVGTHNFKVDRLYLNQGAANPGVFTDATYSNMPMLYRHNFGLDLGDIDGDGDLDAALASHSTQNLLLRNTGAGVFEDVTGTNLPVDNDWTRDAVFADVDDDGDLDLLFVNETKNTLLLNVSE